MRIALEKLRYYLAALTLLVFAPAVMALEQQTLPFHETLECPSENLYLEGSVRFQYHYVESNGGTTWFFFGFWTGEALGLDSGDEFLLRGKWMEVIQNVPEDMPYLFLWNDHFQLIGKGSAPNYDFYNKVKILVNANGEVVINLEDWKTPCPTIEGEIG